MTPASKPVSPRLRALYEEVGFDANIVARFVNDYLSMLDGRVAAIADNLAVGDYSASTISLLSLETTSVMVGASRVAEAARTLRNTVEHQDWSALPQCADSLRAETVAIRASLEAEGYSASSPVVRGGRGTASR